MPASDSTDAGPGASTAMGKRKGNDDSTNDAPRPSPAVAATAMEATDYRQRVGHVIMDWLTARVKKVWVPRDRGGGDVEASTPG